MRKIGRATGIAVFMSFMLAAEVAAQEREFPRTDRMLAASPTELFRVGQLEGPPWEVLGERLQLAFDGAGRLYVLDVNALLLHAYDADGTHRWSGGGAGGGPGEFMRPVAITTVGDGTVAVADAGAGSVAFFSQSDGSYAVSAPIPDGYLASTLASATTGVYLVPSETTVRGDSIPVFHISSLDGVRATRAAHAPRSGVSVTRSSSSGGVRMRRSLPPVFSPSIHIASADDALLISEGAGYALRCLDPGSPPVRLTRAIEPRAVTEADRERVREGMRDAARAQGPDTGSGGFQIQPITPEAMEQRIAALGFADRMPVLADILGAPDGYVWVARSPDPGGEPGPVDLLRDCRYVGTLSSTPIPAALGPGGLVAWIQTTDLGVPVIRVSRVPLDQQAR